MERRECNGKREVYLYRNGERAHAMERVPPRAFDARPIVPGACTSGHACEEKRQTRAQCTYDATH